MPPHERVPAIVRLHGLRKLQFQVPSRVEEGESTGDRVVDRFKRGFTSPAHAQLFLPVHGVVQNLFRVGRHLLGAVHHRMLRARSFTVGQGDRRLILAWTC